MWSYIKFSNVKLSIDLNPFCWGFKWVYEGPTDLDPYLRMQYIRFLGISLLVVIDNGEYVISEDYLTDITPTETKADQL